MYMLRPRNKICKINYFQFFIKSNYIHLSASINKPIIKTIETKCKILGKIKGVIIYYKDLDFYKDITLNRIDISTLILEYMEQARNPIVIFSNYFKR